MRLFLPTLALIGAFLCIPFSLFSTSVIPFANLGEATNYSPCVVMARAQASIETEVDGAIYQDMQFEVLETIKGALSPGAFFSVRPFSRHNASYKIDITGDFKPETGKSYLLFLYQQDEVWRPVMLSFYVFEQFKSGDKEFLVPGNGAGIESVLRPDGIPVEPLAIFHQSDLIQRLKTCAATPGSNWAGNPAPATLAMELVEALDRVVPTGCDFTLGGPNLSRWQDPAIPIYYDDTNIPAGWGGVFSNALGAMSASYTGITPSDAGSVSYVPNCVDGAIGFNSNFLDFCDASLNGSQSTLIIFDDPCNEIPNLSGCSGTLAFGGSYSSSTTHLFDGLTWDDALYGFMVINNGTPDCLDDIQFGLVITHELTHMYRMGHLNQNTYPNQNMNPFCCNDINTKDEECMNYAYPSPAPVELLSFEARKQGEQSVKLEWITETEKDNNYFTLLRSANGLQFEPVQQIQSIGGNIGGKYEWVDFRPLAGLNYYMLQQTDFDGTVQNLGIKAVTVGKSELVLSVQPNPTQNGLLSFNLDLPDDFEGILEVSDPNGLVVIRSTLVLDKGIQRIQQNLKEMPGGVYLLRLFNEQQQWSTRFLKP